MVTAVAAEALHMAGVAQLQAGHEALAVRLPVTALRVVREWAVWVLQVRVCALVL